ncbi:hypothetical protein LSCM1_02633 [Leishmania martiniquensis]|uniref:Uncharacterized protein n=1 Tax=Leishmania martiniquensis TaxID=1580590 RepID=A0A836KAL7_9TRYP|nr:hypothetical protein LSCM1_02633 [Leishmania martiniquensis]
MSIIYVDELIVRLPSDVRNTFNPSYAFSGGGGSNNRASAPVMGLREVQTGHVLLPIDAEGSIVVTPGQRYSVVLIRETRSGSVASAAAPPARTESSSAVNNGRQSSTDDDATKKKHHLALAKLQQQQQPVKQPSLSREAAAPASEAEPPMRFPQKSMSKQERKATRESAIAKEFHGCEASIASAVAEAEQPRKKQKRQDNDAVQALQQHPPRQQKMPPNSNSMIEMSTDDAPLVEAYKASQSHTPPRTSPVMAPSKSGESSRYSSKRGSPRSKAETVVGPPPPMRHSLSSSDGYNDEEGAPSLAQLYGVQSAASHPSASKMEHAWERETHRTVTSKKRHSPSKKTKSTPADTAAPTTALRAQSPTQPATSATLAPAAQMQHQKSTSPDRVLVTLPSSSRASAVRRVPLDTSSDSD